MTCGHGTDTRSRRCLFGNSCAGNSEERRTCNKETCPGELDFYLIMFTSFDAGQEMKK